MLMTCKQQSNSNEELGLLLTLYPTIPSFINPGKSLLKTLWGKGENAGNQHFPLFPQCFLLYQVKFSPSKASLSYHLQMLSILTGLKLIVW